MDKSQLDEKSIGVIIDNKIKASVAWYNSKLSMEREKVIGYYNGDLPKKQKEGSSGYVSNDVYDSVEAMKGQLLETFASGFQIVKFDPQNPQDVESSRIATLYTDYVVHRQNNGYQIFNDAIHDGLTARAGVAKIWWDERYEYRDEEFDGLPVDQVEALASRKEVKELEAEQDEETGLFKGKLTHKIDVSQVRIEIVNPEEFSIEPEAKELSGEYFTCHSTVKTRAELIREGYDKDKIKRINDEDRYGQDMAPEKLARFRQFETNIFAKPDNGQEEREYVLVHECYMKLVRKGSEGERLYKVVRAGSETLDIEEVEELPFIAFVPLPIPHSFYGNNFAAKVIQTQNVRSTLTRQIIDHANITNNPRYTVVRGGLTNPRELLDNRLGGIVNVTRPDAVNPLHQGSLNPFTFQLLQLAEANNEKTTGISTLSQGLNKDAISNQNSQGMINDLVNLSQTRQKVIARNFAFNFLVPLYLRVYKLVLENEKKQKIVELAGNWVQIDPQTWKERKTCTVSFHLGYGEQAREAQKRMQLAAMVMQSPAAQMFQPKGMFNYVSDIFKLEGIHNVTDYITPPDQLPPPQPDPFKVQEMKNESTKAQAALITAQAHQAKVQLQAQFEQKKMAYQAGQDHIKNNLAVTEEKRKVHETANRIDIAQREMHLTETTPSKDLSLIHI